ncbi:hypothetical protein BZG36_03436 [Bifiguratus adelaidae]|uniref:C2H2-type domain-containing protein n=1 Tax=Bifiguratus adelaidae TaxID=1938954 RepID=A0A261XXY3_9FUNG|nr:hypothetical protein BZG36_03436 [Bifiguratus adelaidae]
MAQAAPQYNPTLVISRPYDGMIEYNKDRVFGDILPQHDHGTPPTLEGSFPVEHQPSYMFGNDEPLSLSLRDPSAFTFSPFTPDANFATGMLPNFGDFATDSLKPFHGSLGKPDGIYAEAHDELTMRTPGNDFYTATPPMTSSPNSLPDGETELTDVSNLFAMTSLPSSNHNLQSSIDYFTYPANTSNAPFLFGSSQMVEGIDNVLSPHDLHLSLPNQSSLIFSPHHLQLHGHDSHVSTPRDPQPPSPQSPIYLGETVPETLNRAQTPTPSEWKSEMPQPSVSSPTHCPYDGCSKTFTRSNNLKTHVKSHLTTKPFLCEHCPRSFSRKHDLQRHTRVHTGDKPYVCICCSKKFARTDALKRHHRIEESCRLYVEARVVKDKRRHST